MRCSTHCPSIVSADAAVLRELAVDLRPDGGFVEVEIEPTAARRAAAVEGVELVDGQTAEIASGSTPGWRMPHPSGAVS